MFDSGFFKRAGEDVRTLFWLVAMIALVAVHGCGGGGGGSSLATGVAADESGEVVIAVTDAEGDFEAYEVDVDYLRLQRANGDVVETVPLSTRIDFAELTELTEFFTVATIPAGNYTGVVIGLDFGSADIVVQDAVGNVSAAVAVDEARNPLGRLELTVRLPSDEPITIAPGVPAHVTVDFDLAASNTVDFDVAPAEVIVEPFLFVTGEFERDREHRVRGLLASVDEAAEEITLKVRPFRHRQGNFGRFTFGVDDQTRYDVDGELLSGADGLSAMAGLAEDTPVVTLGSVTDTGFRADAVVAGSSVPWSDVDLIHGVVLAREDDTLTVRGVLLSFRDGFDARRGVFDVQLTDDTIVASRLLDPMLAKGDVSVGQRLSVAGELLDDATLAAERLALHMNQLTASVLQTDPLVVDLALMNGMRPAVFDFSGTGMTPAEDADPEHYEIDTATLALPSVSANDRVRVRGLVNAFGMAPPDFLARTVIDVSTERLAAMLWVGWPDGSAMPFSAVLPDRIDIDLTDARHALKLRGLDVAGGDLAGIALLAPVNGRGAYLVAVRGAGELHAYREFADLVTELDRQLAAGNLLRRIAAHGRYNAGTVELTAPRAGFEFIAP